MENLSSTTLQSQTFCCLSSCRKSWKLAFTHTHTNYLVDSITLGGYINLAFFPCQHYLPSLVKGASTKLYPAISGLLYTHIYFFHNPSNLWWMPNLVSKAFGPAMKTGPFQRYPTTYYTPYFFKRTIFIRNKAELSQIYCIELRNILN